MRLRPSASDHWSGLLSLLFATSVSVAAARQQPVPIDTTAIGPKVGATVPEFSGIDQLGRDQSLSGAMGPKGVMVVFFRSADW